MLLDLSTDCIVAMGLSLRGFSRLCRTSKFLNERLKGEFNTKVARVRGETAGVARAFADEICHMHYYKKNLMYIISLNGNEFVSYTHDWNDEANRLVAIRTHASLPYLDIEFFKVPVYVPNEFYRHTLTPGSATARFVLDSTEQVTYVCNRPHRCTTHYAGLADALESEGFLIHDYE